MNDYVLNELYHHGVMGMKWGVRRYQPYGEGGYDPEHKGKFVGKISKRDQKKLYKALKKVNRQGMYNPSSRTRNKLLKNEDLREAVSSNKKLMKAVKANNKAFDNLNLTRNLIRISETGDKHTDLLKDAETRHEKAMNIKDKEIRAAVKSILGDYADKPVGKLNNGATIRTAKDVLYGMVDQMATRVDRGRPVLPKDDKQVSSAVVSGFGQPTGNKIVIAKR